MYSLLNSDNGDGNENENVTWKYNFILFVLFRDYFYSFNLYKNGELPRNQISRRDVQENEKFTVVCSHFPQNLEFGRFTLIGTLRNHDGNGNENVAWKY